MTAITHALSIALLHFLWQGVVAAALLWTALLVLRNRPANARYAVSCAVFAALAAAPAVTGWLAYRSPAPSQAAQSVRVATGTVLSIPGAAGIDWLNVAGGWALPLWAFGVLICSLRLLWGCREVSVLRRGGSAAPGELHEAATRLARRMGVDRELRLLLTSLADGPSVVGWLRPAILLPAATLAGLTPEQLEAVLAHELAHIRRYDYLVNLVQMVVEALFFYHPAVWWISGRMRHERELCCDDLAVACCGDAVSYARALTNLARLQMHRSFALGAADGPLAYRVKRLLGTVPREFGPSRSSAVAAIVLAVAGMALSVNWARAQSVKDQPGITVDLHGSEVLHREPVKYPAAAAANGSQGNVTVEVTLDDKGNVTDAHVTGGPQAFRKQVLQSVLTWRFAPDATGTTRQVSVDFQKASIEQQRSAKPEEPAGTGGAQGFFPGVADMPLDFKGTVYIDDRETVRAEIEKKEAHIEAMRQQQSRASEQGVTQLQDAINRDTEIVRHWEADLRGTVDIIDIEGFSPEQRAALQAQLPFHLGDKVTVDSARQAQSVVSQVDHRAKAAFEVMPDGKLAFNVILPGGGQ